MHEKGLGLRRDIHLAKRFYDLAAEASVDAYLPVTLALIKLNLLFYVEFFERKYDNLFNQFSMIQSDWDIYLMTILAILIGFIYMFRRRT
jgi:SEL1 protein